MPVEITMPQQSDTMTEGTVVKWLKKEGDKIKPGEIIAEIETDKATMEMEAFDAGTLAVILVGAGQKAPVGAPIALMATSKESIEDVKKNAGSATVPKPASGPAPQTKPAAQTAPAPQSLAVSHPGSPKPAAPTRIPPAKP